MNLNKKLNFDKIYILTLQELYNFKNNYYVYKDNYEKLSKNKHLRLNEFKNNTNNNLRKISDLYLKYLSLIEIVKYNTASKIDVLFGNFIGFSAILIDIKLEKKICEDDYILPYNPENQLLFCDDYRIGTKRKVEYFEYLKLKLSMKSNVEILKNIELEIKDIKYKIALDESEVIKYFNKINNISSEISEYKFGKSNKINYFSYKIEFIEKLINEKKNNEISKAKEAAFDLKQRDYSTVIKNKIKNQIDLYENCPYCNNNLNMNDAHADHIYPINKGGQSTSSNMVYICSSCNLSKRDSTLRNFLIKKKLDENHVFRILHLLNKDF